MSATSVHELEEGASVVEVTLPDASYPVFIGNNAAAYFARWLRENSSARRIAIIADENTAELFGLIYETLLIDAGFEVIPFTVTDGEEVKCLTTVSQLLEAFARQGLKRSDMVISLGGGVVSDLAGLTAALYMRGIAFAQISTSLLSMVDASIGGKTGVDLEAGKNLAGTFYHPITVLMDTDTLKTLPEEEFANGMAEVVKTALLDGPEAVQWLTEHTPAICERDGATLRALIARCVIFKASIVAQDVHDHGVRESLNFGHTLGHAIEKTAGYGVVAHGRAVAQGIRFAARVAAQKTGDIDFVRAQDGLLDSFGLEPVAPPAVSSELFGAMTGDKKVLHDAIRMVLLEKPGVWHVEQVDETVIRAHLAAWCGEGE